MGLGMWLERSVFVGGMYDKPENIKVDGEHKTTLHLDVDKHHIEIDLTKIGSIREEIAYWHGANAIHDWFIENCANGDTVCSEMYVSKEQLIELRSLCKEILDTPEDKRDDVAADLLSPCWGFLFGSQEIDDYYYENLRYTVDVLKDIEDDDADSYYYSCSW